MRIEQYKLPAFLASALINGDTSGLGEDDFKWLDAAIKLAGNGSYVDCDDESFFTRYTDLPGFNLGCDVLTYTVIFHE